MRRMHISMDIMAANLFMVLSPFLGDGGIIAHLPPPVNLFGEITIVFSLYCEIVRLVACSWDSLHASANNGGGLSTILTQGGLPILFCFYIISCICGKGISRLRARPG